MSAPTLTRALAARGLSHRPSQTSINQYARDVLDSNGHIVVAGTAAQVWEWLNTYHAKAWPVVADGKQ